MFAVTLASALTVLAAEGVDPNLDAYAWDARPILVFAADGDPRLAEQLARFEAAAPDLADRENVVIVETEADSRLSRSFRPGDFTVILIGKDGGEKFRANRLVAVEELNTLIDAMPMRRNEMRTKERRTAE
ncbi:MAG: DUF4174 domain-containing protein [Pseudomonadota bacterium]